MMYGYAAAEDRLMEATRVAASQKVSLKRQLLELIARDNIAELPLLTLVTSVVVYVASPFLEEPL